MGRDINRVTLLGRLGRDAELRGGTVLSMRLACSRSWKGRDGEWQEETEWVSVTAFGKLAQEFAHTPKGTPVFAEGRLRTRSWDDKKTGQKRYATEVIADVIMTPAIAKGGKGGSGEGALADAPVKDSFGDDDIPF